MNKVRNRAAAGFIESEIDLARGVKASRRVCPIMRHVHDTAGDPPLRRRAAGFDGLARIIVGQQLSVASANAIWGRLSAMVQPISAGSIWQEADEGLRACGLSGGKIRTLRELAAAVECGDLDVDGLVGRSDAEVHAALTAVSGIGPWTADVYILFCLGRADAFAVGDLALQIAAQHAAGLAERPRPAELLELAERWRPWRAVAACMLWAYYPHIRKLRIAGDRSSGAPV